jgi:hypothetical protein
MTNDTAAIARIHPIAGILSNLGVLLWCASASICLFAAFMSNPGSSFASFCDTNAYASH